MAIGVSDHVATVTLSRPSKHNALDLAMFEQLAAASERLAHERGVRAVVLHGEGPSFCSGIDLQGVLAAPADGSALLQALEGPVPNVFQRCAYGWVTLPVPVICALQGNCLGGGLQIALGADIRIARADARLSVMEARWGLIPDMAITRTLPRLVGIDVAKELLFSARVLNGEEAHRLGLVTHLAEDPVAAARALAAQIAARSPDAVRAAKRLLEDSWCAPAQVSLELEVRLQRRLIGSPNQLEALRAGLGGEDPRFQDAE